MAHHSHHPRQITLTVPRIDTGALIRRAHWKLRQFEGMVARHWPFAAYTALTLAVAGYVIATLVTITT